MSASESRSGRGRGWIQAASRSRRGRAGRFRRVNRTNFGGGFDDDPPPGGTAAAAPAHFRSVIAIGLRCPAPARTPRIRVSTGP
jgi:hypothetical protein